MICCFHDGEVKFKMPEGYDLSTAKLLLCNEKDPKDDLLGPYECRVYCWDR